MILKSKKEGKICQEHRARVLELIECMVVNGPGDPDQEAKAGGGEPQECGDDCPVCDGSESREGSPGDGGGGDSDWAEKLEAMLHRLAQQSAQQGNSDDVTPKDGPPPEHRAGSSGYYTTDVNEQMAWGGMSISPENIRRMMNQPQMDKIGLGVALEALAVDPVGPGPTNVDSLDPKRLIVSIRAKDARYFRSTRKRDPRVVILAVDVSGSCVSLSGPAIVAAAAARQSCMNVGVLVTSDGCVASWHPPLQGWGLPPPIENATAGAGQTPQKVLDGEYPMKGGPDPIWEFGSQEGVIWVVIGDYQGSWAYAKADQCGGTVLWFNSSSADGLQNFGRVYGTPVPSIYPAPGVEPWIEWGARSHMVAMAGFDKDMLTPALYKIAGSIGE